jgi:hypothetical protein
MGKVVYLFGAGASYGVRDKLTPRIDYSLEYRNYKGVHQKIEGSAPNIVEGLPIVAELPERMDYIRYLIKKEIKDLAIDTKPEAPMFERLEESLAWLQEASQGHATVDTFAKKLFLTGRVEEYDRLKRTLCAYFLLEQLTNKVDKRYDAFLAAVLGSNASDLPDNIRILSWNYDVQLELAYSEYLQDNNLDTIEQAFLCFNKTLDVNRYRRGNGFRVIKLNGSALVYNRSTRSIYNPFIDTINLDVLNNVSSLIYDSSYDCALSFAWENADDFFFEKIKSNISDAEVLVVIGYSFPYFNRTVDKILFQSMPALKTIYIQDIAPAPIEQSVSNLLTPSHAKINKTKIEPRNQTQQFYLPPEL